MLSRRCGGVLGLGCDFLLCVVVSGFFFWRTPFFGRYGPLCLLVVRQF
jgi:hypothetical protein